MFDKLKKHHLGFIIPLSEREEIERKFGRKFHYDAIQQTHVLFVYDETLRIYKEYICQEGRAARSKPGFIHICYNVKDRAELESVDQFINDHKMGFRLTPLEESGSEECGLITFYFLKDHGMIELNLPGKKGAGNTYHDQRQAGQALEG